MKFGINRLINDLIGVPTSASAGGPDIHIKLLAVALADTDTASHIGVQPLD